MKFLHKPGFQRLIGLFKTESISMRRRLVIYIISALVVLVSLILLLLNLFGIMNPVKRQISDALDVRLSGYAQDVRHDYDTIAAYAISFSEQLETQLQHFLSENGIAFGDLKNDTEAISQLQGKLYDIVYLNMQLAPSSGAFYLLDTTVNSETNLPYYSGIYLKYVNLNSENTVNNAFTLYRGAFATGNTNSITFHSGWQSELRTDFFETYNEIFTDGVYYALSPAVSIPETWEMARYVYVPIHDLKGNVIGVCGFEVNDLYFQLTHKTVDDRLGHMVYALLDRNDYSYSGQFSASRFSAASSSTTSVNVTEKNGILTFDFGIDRCIGKATEVQLGKNTFTAAVMLTQEQYDNIVHQGQMKVTLILFIATLFSFVWCAFMSTRYLAPILKRIEHMKTSGESVACSNIREIDDLFAFLAEKDSLYREQLAALEKEKLRAEEETLRTKFAYERALEEYQQVQSEIHQLSNRQNDNVDPEEYAYFIRNLRTLTVKETQIYELYLCGKTAKEITEIIDITENTLKYHNKNIYNKLGVSSRKQLLRFASHKWERDGHQPLQDTEA